MLEFANFIHAEGQNSIPGKYVELPELVAYQAFGQEVNRFGALLYVLGSLYFQFPVEGWVLQFLLYGSHFALGN